MESPCCLADRPSSFSPPLSQTASLDARHDFCPEHRSGPVPNRNRAVRSLTAATFTPLANHNFCRPSRRTPQVRRHRQICCPTGAPLLTITPRCRTPLRLTFPTRHSRSSNSPPRKVTRPTDPHRALPLPTPAPLSCRRPQVPSTLSEEVGEDEDEDIPTISTAGAAGLAGLASNPAFGVLPCPSSPTAS